MKIVFFLSDGFENSYNGTGQGSEILTWEYLCLNFGADTLCLIDLTTNKIAKNFRKAEIDIKIKYEYYTGLEEIENKYKGSSFIYMESKPVLEKNQVKFTWLEEFVHPDNAIYVVGSDYNKFVLTDYVNDYQNKTWVSIKTIRKYLWSYMAMGIVLYDRLIKGNL